MPTLELPKYVKPEKDRKGNVRYCYFRKGGKRTKMAEPMFSAAWWSHYEELVAGAPKILTNTLGHMIADYKKSPAWSDLAIRTQEDYTSQLKLLHEVWGKTPAANISTQHVVRLQDRLQNKVSAKKADRVAIMLSTLFKWGKDRGYRSDNPCANIKKRYKAKRTARPWPDEFRDAFFALEVPPSQRVRYEAVKFVCYLGMYLGQRRYELINAKERDYKHNQGVVSFFPNKTKNTSGVELEVPVCDALLPILQGRKTRHLMLCVDHEGKKWTDTQLSRSFRTFANMVSGDFGYVKFHDLRATCAVELKLAGSTDAEIMAITGHTTSEMIRHYTKYINQSTLAKSGIDKLNRSLTKQ